MKHFYFLYFLYFLVACSSQRNPQNTVNADSSVTSGNMTGIDRSVPMPDDTLRSDFGIIIPGSISCVIVKEAHLMEDTLLRNKTGISLHLGDEVRMLANNTYVESAWNRSVYYITVKKNNGVSEGYLSQTDLAVCKKRLSDGNVFLLGLTGPRKNKNEYSVMGGKALIINSRNEVLAEKELELIGGEHDGKDVLHYYHSIETNIMPSSGLAGAVNVIDLHMHYDACGYTNGHIFLLWDGKQMHYAFECHDSSDAGIYASYSSAIFPSDAGGKEGKILSVANEVAYDSEKEDMPEITHDSLVVQYGWDPGKGVIPEDTIFKGSQLKTK